MELRYPLLLLILLVAGGYYIYKYRNHKKEYIAGVKIANTNYIKKSSYYQEKLKKYNIIKKAITMCSIISIFISIFMISRPCKIDTKDSDEYNRDIFLCMDVSGSVNSLNIDVVDSLIDTVNSLKGERFGISAFDSSSVVLVPLTDDYEYVIDVLKKVKKSLGYHDYSVEHDYKQERQDEDYYYINGYIVNGTMEGSGSSLIGDGLASCVYSFSNMDEKRTRIIIFSTDNSLAGKPLVDLSTAADISKSKGIKVFGIATKNISTQDAKEYKAAVEKTGGKYYEHGKKAMQSIISDIESTSKSKLKNQMETNRSDVPLIPFLSLLISFSILIILNKKVLG